MIVANRKKIVMCERFDRKGHDFSDPLRSRVVSYRSRSDASHDKMCNVRPALELSKIPWVIRIIAFSDRLLQIWLSQLTVHAVQDVAIYHHLINTSCNARYVFDMNTLHSTVH